MMTSTLLFILYCLEAGVFFILAPWTRFWTSNPLFQSTELIAQLTESFYIRGLVSGIGVLHILIGLREVVLLLQDRRTARVVPEDSER